MTEHVELTILVRFKLPARPAVAPVQVAVFPDQLYQKEHVHQNLPAPLGFDLSHPLLWFPLVELARLYRLVEPVIDHSGRLSRMRNHPNSLSPRFFKRMKHGKVAKRRTGFMPESKSRLPG